MKAILLACFTLLPFLPKIAAQVSTSEVLATARQDIRVQQSEKMAQTASSLRFHLPLLREVEARVGFRGSVLGDTIYGYLRNEDIYGLIISPNSLRVIKSQKAFQQAQINVYSAQRQMYLDEALILRYEALVGWYYAEQEAAGQKTLLDLLAKKLELLRLTAEKGLDIRVKDVVDTEEDRLKAVHGLMDAQQEHAMCLARIRQFLGTVEEVVPDTGDFVSLATISRFVQFSDSVAYAVPGTAFRERVGALEAVRLRLQNAQNRQIFTDLRISYDYPLYLTRPNRFNTFNNFSLRVGLTLPLPGNNNFRRSNAMLDLKEAQMSAQRFAQNTREEARMERMRLSRLLDIYNSCRLVEAESLIPGMLANPELIAMLNPMDLVDLEIARQQMTLRTLETARDATLSYVRLLYLSGLLGRDPPVNWLSEQGAAW